MISCSDFYAINWRFPFITTQIWETNKQTNKKNDMFIWYASAVREFILENNIKKRSHTLIYY